MTGKKYRRLSDDTFSLCGLTMSNCTGVHIEGVEFDFFTYSNVSITSSTSIIFKDCLFMFSQYSSGAKTNKSDVDFINCISAHAGSDGFGFSVSGECNLYNCSGLHCYDDGVSHHDSTSGIIDGGEWLYNGKGGVTPSYGSLVSVKNVYCSGNNYGLLYAANIASTSGGENRYTDRMVTATNCVCVGNITKDVRVEDYNLILSTSTYNTIEIKSDAYTSVTEYNNNKIQ
jgi:hypothetical protein